MTDIALVTTTIGVPDVLRRYREIGPDVEIIVAGDLKTPAETIQLVRELHGWYLSPVAQAHDFPRLSQVIGWNSIQRRNIAILAAARLGADIIVTVDDDNHPREDSYFDDIERALTEPYHGETAYGDWFDIGAFADQPFTYRGTPQGVRSARLAAPNGSGPDGVARRQPHLALRRLERIGVVNGLIYGDPDIDAIERLVRDPLVSAYSHDARGGIATHPRHTWAPINSQNTAWRAELAPLMLLPPGIGRYDDIWGSYIAQRVMGALDYAVLFGKPYVTQERNEHDVFSDLEQELYGMRHADRFVDAVRSAPVRVDASVTANLALVLAAVERAGPTLPAQTVKFLDAWTNHWAEMAVAA